jgi:hypothetical protein
MSSCYEDIKTIGKNLAYSRGNMFLNQFLLQSRSFYAKLLLHDIKYILELDFILLQFHYKELQHAF